MKRYFVMMLTIAMAFSLSVFAVEPGEPVFVAVRAIRIAERDVVVEFSMPIDDNGVDHPYVAIRMCYVKANGETAGLAWEGNDPLQFSARSKGFYQGDRQRIVLNFSKTMMDDYLSPDNPYVLKGLRPFLCLEEKNPPDGHDEYTLFDVKSTDGQELRCNYSGEANAWDGVYLPIEIDDSYVPGKIPVVTEPVPPPPQTDIVTFLPPVQTDSDLTEPKAGCGSVIGCLPAMVMVSAAYLIQKRK